MIFVETTVFTKEVMLTPEQIKCLRTLVEEWLT